MPDGLMLLIQFIILIISLFFLVKSSDLVSDSASKISRMTGLGEMAVGFLILSVITSLPELAVSISAINSKDVGISIGGLFGSNVANIGLVLGLTAIFAPSIVNVTQESFKKLSLMLLIASLIPILALVLTGLSRFVGLALLLSFAFFCVYSIKSNVKVEVEEAKGEKGMRRAVLLMLGGVGVVLLSAQFAVSSSVSISEFFGIEKAVIGATVIAIGTSLPELSVSLAAARRNHMNLALGNILGSCVTNLTLILGVVLAASTLKINLAIFAELVVILVLVNLTLWRMLLGNKIDFFDGVILIFLYAIFLGSTIGVEILVLSPGYTLPLLGALSQVFSSAFAYGIVALAALILGITLTKR